MISVFLAFSRCYGLKEIVLIKGDVTTIDLKNKSGIFAFPHVKPGDLILNIIDPKKNFTASKLVEQYMHFVDEEMTLESKQKEPMFINYWELPIDFCPMYNFVFDAENDMEFSSLVDLKNDIQCVFSPFKFSQMRFSMVTSIAYPEVYGINISKKLDIKQGATFNNPFFIRLLPNQLVYTFDFTASARNSPFNYCHFDSIPICLDFIAVPGTWQGIIDDTKCINSHEPLLFYAKFTFGASIVIFFSSIIIYMHNMIWSNEDMPQMIKNDTEYLINEDLSG